MLKNMKEYSAKSFDGVISDQEVFEVWDQTLKKVKEPKGCFWFLRILPAATHMRERLPDIVTESWRRRQR